MLVTFRTDAHESITFFGEVANRLLRMMGNSATIPGAILAQDVPIALSYLKKALEAEKQHVSMPKEEEGVESKVSITHRALPLLALLQAAADNNCDVLWS